MMIGGDIRLWYRRKRDSFARCRDGLNLWGVWGRRGGGGGGGRGRGGGGRRRFRININGWKVLSIGNYNESRFSRRMFVCSWSVDGDGDARPFGVLILG